MHDNVLRLVRRRNVAHLYDNVVRLVRRSNVTHPTALNFSKEKY